LYSEVSGMPPTARETMGDTIYSHPAVHLLFKACSSRYGSCPCMKCPRGRVEHDMVTKVASCVCSLCMSNWSPLSDALRFFNLTGRKCIHVRNLNLALTCLLGWCKQQTLVQKVWSLIKRILIKRIIKQPLAHTQRL
jgi:hypothetical protein